jgi:hypothetical protein
VFDLQRFAVPFTLRIANVCYHYFVASFTTLIRDGHVAATSLQAKVSAELPGAHGHAPLAAERI